MVEKQPGGYIVFVFLAAFDPAQPGFEGADPLVRLDNTDANFVDVVHTNGRAIIGFGERESVGHSDFFVNGKLNVITQIMIRLSIRLRR